MSFLPGHFPAGAPEALERIQGLTFVSADAPNLQRTSCTLPADIRKGDIVLIVHAGDDFGGPTDTSPDGFEQIFSHWGSGNYVLNTYWRVCDGTEDGATVTVSPVGDNNNFVGRLLFRPTAGYARDFNIHDSATAETSANPGGQDINSTGAVGPALAIVVYYSDGSVTGETVAQFDGAVQTSVNLHIGYGIENVVTGVARVVDMGDGGGNNLYAAFVVEFS